MNGNIKNNESRDIIIYAIETFTKLEQKQGFPDFGSECIVGFYTDKDTAFKAVKNNYCDIYETCYDYALIEEVEEGLYPCSTTRWLFKYNKNNGRYELIQEPDWLKHFSGLIM